MTLTILFLCPHGAAKSVLAMTFFKQLAADHGLDAHVSNAGTEPDETINPKVAAYLLERGIDMQSFVPPLLGDAQLNAADHVVSIGCISAEATPSSATYHDWSDVPMLSSDFDASVQRIQEHTTAFIQQLTSSEQL